MIGRRQIINVLAPLAIVLSTPIAFAQTLEDHRSRAIQVAGIGVEKSLRPNGVWFSSISNLSASSGNLAGADGSPIFSMPAAVASGYDSSVAYDVSGFYQGLRKTRVNFILNYSTETHGEVVSFGFDPGAQSEKATVKRALFVGYTRALVPQKSVILTFSTGAWIFSGMNETPCIDSYDRQYHCRSLTAWSDYSSPKYRTPYYFDLRLGFRF
jgi:hypothetical protein